jgi:hypothetical protein
MDNRMMDPNKTPKVNYIRVCGVCTHHEDYDTYGLADRQRCGKCGMHLPFKVTKRGVE